MRKLRRILFDNRYHMIVIVRMPIALTFGTTQDVDTMGCLHLELTDDHGDDHPTA